MLKHGRIRIHGSNSNEAPRGSAEFHNPYTPGPYTLSGGKYVGICAIIEGVSRQIGRAEVVGTPGVISDRECEANASLFAAAPDLLEALKMVRTDFLEFEGCYCGQIIGGSNGEGEPLHVCGWCTTEAAIAKAEGR